MVEHTKTSIESCASKFVEQFVEEPHIGLVRRCEQTFGSMVDLLRLVACSDVGLRGKLSG